jgi:hypothetical protein
VSEIRLAFIHEVRTLHTPVSLACQKFKISRKTAYKWLTRYQQQPGLPLTDRSRRPKSSPRRTPESLEQAVLASASSTGGRRSMLAAPRAAALTAANGQRPQAQLHP